MDEKSHKEDATSKMASHEIARENMIQTNIITMDENSHKENIASKMASNKIARENLIETAVKFLVNPRVVQSSISHKTYFLKKKGLTDQEIDIALNRCQANLPINSQTVMRINHSDNYSLWSRLQYFSTTTVLIGTSLYFIYKFYRKCIYPYLFGSSNKEEAFSKLVEVVNSLDRSIKVLESSMTSFKCRLEEYCSKLDSLSDSSNLNKTTPEDIKSLKNDISSLKGLLLNRKQFPPTPSLNPGIPSWQQVQQIKESDNAIDDSGSSADSNESSPKSSEKNLNSKPEEKNSKFQDNNSSDNGSYVCVDELSEEN
ncbi:Peroxisomal membrane protein PEX14 [Nymphon striatum]|nr:Peroxisomal membrane protein PEX14 [Nymphon striatum]